VGGINIKGVLRKEAGKGGIILIRIHRVRVMLELDQIGNYNKPIIDLIHHIPRIFHNHIQCPVYRVHLICLIDKLPSRLLHTSHHLHSNSRTHNIRITDLQSIKINNQHHSKLHHIDITIPTRGRVHHSLHLPLNTTLITTTTTILGVGGFINPPSPRLQRWVPLPDLLLGNQGCWPTTPRQWVGWGRWIRWS
jgi:hypothetical protein